MRTQVFPTAASPPETRRTSSTPGEQANEPYRLEFRT
jgi:hypothetical protein